MNAFIGLLIGIKRGNQLYLLSQFRGKNASLVRMRSGFRYSPTAPWAVRQCSFALRAGSLYTTKRGRPAHKWAYLWGIRIMAITPAFQAGNVGSIPIYPSRPCKDTGTQLVIMRWFAVERNGPDTDRVKKTGTQSKVFFGLYGCIAQRKSTCLLSKGSGFRNSLHPPFIWVCNSIGRVIAS